MLEPRPQSSEGAAKRSRCARNMPGYGVRGTYWLFNINKRFNVVESTKSYQNSMLIRARRERNGACARLGQHNYNQSHGCSQPFNETISQEKLDSVRVRLLK